MHDTVAETMVGFGLVMSLLTVGLGLLMFPPREYTHNSHQRPSH